MKLQALIDIAEYYGKLYRIQYGASKTKITVSGSNVDIEYYSDTKPWNMNGKPIDVVENNDHLGQIISGTRQEDKNVNLRIKKARNSLFALLGPAFSFKCLLSPILKLHLYRTFVCPVLRSGLSSFVLKNTTLYPLSVFQRKTLRGVLKLSKQSSTPALHFLTGELPVEATIHRDVFSLLYSIWCNPKTKIYEIVNYLFSHVSENSKTWSNFVKLLSKQYGLEDPVYIFRKYPPEKSKFKNDVLIRIRSFHEAELRKHASDGEKLKYFNVSILGLSGRCHPALSGLITNSNVCKSRYHLKMLIGDFFLL